MMLNLLDYRGLVNEFEIGDLEAIKLIYIEVISGDEVANVVYKDGTEKQFDSGENRRIDYLDGSYEIYNSNGNCNVIEKEVFKNRSDSYDYFDNRES